MDLRYCMLSMESKKLRQDVGVDDEEELKKTVSFLV